MKLKYNPLTVGDLKKAIMSLEDDWPIALTTIDNGVGFGTLMNQIMVYTPEEYQDICGEDDDDFSGGGMVELIFNDEEEEE